MCTTEEQAAERQCCCGVPLVPDATGRMWAHVVRSIADGVTAVRCHCARVWLDRPDDDGGPPCTP